MFSRLKKDSNGFTIIELMVVVIILCFLVALIITTHSGIEAQNRNSTRKGAVDHVAAQLEVFYSDRGYYPSEADLSSAAWDNTNLPKLAQSYLHDPSASGTGITLAMTGTKPGSYVYVAKDINGSASNCEAKDTTCSSFTLTAPLENGGTYVKNNTD